MADEKKERDESTAAADRADAAPDEPTRLAEELARKTEEAAANHDRYLRAVAEAENWKKRLQREKTESIRYANENLLRDLLQVIDSLELALEHADEGGNGKSVVEGLQLTLRLFRDILQRHGVKELENPTGRPFDPSTQEAGAIEEKAGAAANTVIRSQSKGYLYNDRLLRPARVVVASAPTRGPDPETVH